MAMTVGRKVEILYDGEWWPGAVQKMLEKNAVEVVFDVDKHTLPVQCQDIAKLLRSPQATTGTSLPSSSNSKKRRQAAGGSSTTSNGNGKTASRGSDNKNKSRK